MTAEQTTPRSFSANWRQFIDAYLGPLITVYFPFEIAANAMDYFGFDRGATVLNGIGYLAFIFLVSLLVLPGLSNQLNLTLRKPAYKDPWWRVSVACVLTVLAFNAYSASKADEGGAIRSWQKALQTMGAPVNDPRARLNLLGYKLEDDELSRAIRQHDEEVVWLFAQAKFRLSYPAPLLILLDDEWDPKIATLLTEEMFQKESACKDPSTWQQVAIVSGFIKNLRPDQPEKAATLKRLCKSNVVIESLESRLTSDNLAPELRQQYQWGLAYLKQ